MDCERDHQRTKRAKRPDLYNDAKERERRRRVVADHRAIVGDWCPGWGNQPAHQSADLTADHVKEVAAGGRVRGRLVVRCRSCNAAKARAVLALQSFDLRVPPAGGSLSTPRPPKFASSPDDGEATASPGPAVA